MSPGSPEVTVMTKIVGGNLRRRTYSVAASTSRFQKCQLDALVQRRMILGCVITEYHRGCMSDSANPQVRPVTTF